LEGAKSWPFSFWQTDFLRFFAMASPAATTDPASRHPASIRTSHCHRSRVKIKVPPNGEQVTRVLSAALGFRLMQKPAGTLEVVALFGPTGVGKTEVAIALADLLRVRKERPIAISADALQVYRGLETLTGAATDRDQARLEHRLLSFVPVESEFSVGEFRPCAHAEIDAALASGRRPIVVGGTGLYLRAALTDLSLKPPPPPELRARIEREVAERGPETMHATLNAAAAATIA